MKPSKVLDRAANIVLRDGWHQGSYYKEPAEWADGDDLKERDEEANRSAPCCQAGAISRAVFGLAWRRYRSRYDDIAAASGADSFMRRYILKTYTITSPIEWNDQPGMTAEAVVEALRGAANMARGEGK